MQIKRRMILLAIAASAALLFTATVYLIFAKEIAAVIGTLF